jgi:hypothetical protein
MNTGMKVLYSYTPNYKVCLEVKLVKGSLSVFTKVSSTKVLPSLCS